MPPNFSDGHFIEYIPGKHSRRTIVLALHAILSGRLSLLICRPLLPSILLQDAKAAEQDNLFYD